MSATTATVPTTDRSAARPALARRLLAGAGVAIVLVFLALLFAALAGREGIVSTNDGSHYALTKALAADGTIRIDRYVNYGAIQPRTGTPTPDDYRDVSFYNGHFYSDRPPGTAFLAVPAYWLGALADRLLARPGLDLPLRFVMAVPPLLGAATVLALYWLARGLGASSRAAVATAAAGSLTTLILKYATLLYSHIAGAACLTAALALVLLAGRQPGRGWPLVLAGLALGYGAVAEYPNLPLVAPVLLYVAWRAWRDGAGLRGPILFLAGWLPPVALLAGYQWAAFGAPWRTSYTYHYYFDWARSPLTTYVTPPLEGLHWLLLGERGLFVASPLLLLALWGLILLARRDPVRALLLGGVALAVLLPTSAHRTFYGGGSQDTRYLLAIVPPLLAPLGLWLDWAARRRAPLRVALLVGAAILAGWGALRSFLSLLAMFGHRAAEYDPGAAWRLLGRNWSDTAVIAPALPTLPAAAALIGPAIGLCWLVWAIGTATSAARPRRPG